MLGYTGTFFDHELEHRLSKAHIHKPHHLGCGCKVLTQTLQESPFSFFLIYHMANRGQVVLVAIEMARYLSIYIAHDFFVITHFYFLQFH